MNAFALQKSSVNNGTIYVTMQQYAPIWVDVYSFLTHVHDVKSSMSVDTCDVIKEAGGCVPHEHS
jgi:hypothetical protein